MSSAQTCYRYLSRRYSSPLARGNGCCFVRRCERVSYADVTVLSYIDVTFRSYISLHAGRHISVLVHRHQHLDRILHQHDPDSCTLVCPKSYTSLFMQPAQGCFAPLSRKVSLLRDRMSPPQQLENPPIARNHPRHSKETPLPQQATPLPSASNSTSLCKETTPP